MSSLRAPRQAVALRATRKPARAGRLRHPGLALAVGAVVGAIFTAGAMHAEETAKKRGCGAVVAADSELARTLSGLFVALADAADAHADVVGKTAGADAIVEANGLRAVARSWRDLAGDAARTSSLLQRSTWWPPVAHDERALRDDPRLHDARRRAIAYARDVAADASAKSTALEDVEASTSPSASGQSRGGTTPR